MHQRPLGTTGFNISETGFGAWAIGADWGSPVAESDALATLAAAFDSGVNFVDTADVYGAGRSESLVGQAVKSAPSPVVVATKMGRFGDWSDSADAIEKAAEASCKRLGVDTLDLVQLHCIPTATLEAGRAFSHLEALKSKGLIRHYGVSVESIAEGLFCLRESGAASLQVIFNIFRQRVAHDLLPAAEKARVAIIARVPLASGLLTGKFSQNHAFPRSDHRNFNADGQCFNVGETFAGVPFHTGVALAEAAGDILDSDPAPGSRSQKALRWILDHPAVSTVIPGAKSPAQATENAAASALPPLSQATHAALRSLYSDQIDHAIRGVY